MEPTNRQVLSKNQKNIKQVKCLSGFVHQIPSRDKTKCRNCNKKFVWKPEDGYVLVR